MSEENLLVLDPEQFRLPPSNEIVAGTNVSSTPSPYDIPEAVYSFKDDQGSYVVQLKYMGTGEPVEEKAMGEALEVKTGRNSKRIYEFVVHSAGVQDTKETALGLIRASVANLLSDSFYTRKTNYRLVSRMLEKVGEKVFQPESTVTRE
jgi:hypothetical protein